MLSRPKYRGILSILVGTGLLILGGFFLREPIFFAFFYEGTRADWEFQQIRNEYARKRQALADLRRSSGSDRKIAGERERFDRWQGGVRGRCMRIAEENPGKRAEVASLLFVTDRWPESVEGRTAHDRLLHLASCADISVWARALDEVRGSNEDIDRWRPIVARLVECIKERPDHPDAARLACQAGNLVAPDGDAESAPVEFVAIADLIGAHYAASTEIANFCEQVGGLPTAYAPGWGRGFEPHLRAILDVNEDRFVRCSSKMALASVVLAGGIGRQPEARRLFEEFLAEFDGETRHRTDGIEQMYRDTARRILDTIRTHGLGAPAPVTVGVDLDGRPISLADFRGKAVLVSFWATWCYPCMKAIPHEKALLERFGPEQFAIVGVNADEDPGVAREAVAEHGIPWRSFRGGRGDGTSIADDWHVAGYPTLYLLDAEGVIVGTWLGMPPQRELERAIGDQFSDPEREEDVPSDGTESGGNTRGDGRAPATASVEVVADTPGATGFVAKVLRLDDGRESRYVVFIPENYDEARSYPAILFLHGSGGRGADGQRHIGALAEAIRLRDDPFPFIVVFPQAPQGSADGWQPRTGHGELAIAVLEDVVRHYSVDADRVALTGVSMGGEGTWSLASAYPDRWSAIVPLCGGGDTGTVARFAHIPCWCFQGGADRMTPPGLSREMVRALRQAGGRPIYVEYPDVGHNCWDRAYACDDLFEWLKQQRRGRGSASPEP